MSFPEISGYPSWENYIPEFKNQTLIMSIMAELAYERQYELYGAILDENNNFLELGTMIYFTASGRYTIFQPQCGAERLRVSYPNGKLVSRYYQFPIPGVPVNPIPGFDFAFVLEATVSGNIATLVLDLNIEDDFKVGENLIVEGFTGTDATYFNTPGTAILSVNQNIITYTSNLPGPYVAQNPEEGKVKLFDFDTNYKPGAPPVYGPDGPLYNNPDKTPCPIDLWPWPEDLYPTLDTITYCVPNPGQPFLNQSASPESIAANVFGYYKPPPPPCPDDPYVIAFHCLINSKAVSNNPLDTLQYFQFQSLAIRYKAEIGVKDFGDGVDRHDEDGNLLPYCRDSDCMEPGCCAYPEDNEPIAVIYPLNEVDYFRTFAGVPNLSFGYNLMFNTFVFSFRGSTYLPDFLEEVIPPEILIQNLGLANPQVLLDRYRPWLVNKATSMYKSIAKTTNFDYFLTPFPEEGSIQILKNYPTYLGATTFVGHSYGGSLANILAEYLVIRFPFYVNVQTYAFAPVPYLRKCAPPLDVDTFFGFLLIRGFTNDNDCVPFLKVPNFLTEPQEYFQSLYPSELYDFYHIKSCEGGAVLERINGYCFPNGGVPIYLSINKDHSLTNYIGNISKINTKQFEDTIFNENGLTNFTISNKDIVKTFLASIPVALGGSGEVDRNYGVTFAEDPLLFLYKFAGLQTIDVSYNNLIDSLRLNIQEYDCSDPTCHVTYCCDPENPNCNCCKH